MGFLNPSFNMVLAYVENERKQRFLKLSIHSFPSSSCGLKISIHYTIVTFSMYVCHESPPKCT